MTGRTALWPLGLVALLVASLFVWLLNAPGQTVELAGYATSLRERSPGQKRNARLAAAALDGAVIAPGATFSFNSKVQSWSQDAGYVKAPVSFDGELVRAYGGGVCQTSTTLYNAVLLAGLPILERHPHVFRPAYAAPGRDAAVAFPGIDLRFRNPTKFPLKIRARADDQTLSIRLLGHRETSQTVRVETQILSASQPLRLTRSLESGGNVRRRFLRSPGLAGCRALAWRVWLENGREIRREKLSDDSYPTMNRVMALQN